MKILLLPSWYPDDEKQLNGIFFKEQAEALVKENIEVIVLSINIKDIRNINFKKKLNSLKITNENGVKVYRYNTYNYFPKLQELYLKYYSKLVEKFINEIIINEGNIDLIHIHSALDMGIAYVKSKINFPYVITEHSTKYSRNIINKTQKKYLPLVFNKAEKVISVGKGLKEEIDKYAGNKKVDIIPNLVNMPKKNISKELIKKGKFRFFSLGLLTYKKGMDLLIEAYNLGKNELKDVELLIGGDGEERDNIQALIDKYELNDRVFLLGQLNREEVAKNMMECDSFILASRFETFGIVYIEAMNYGKPIIATKTGGPDTFLNEKCGILVENENIEEIKKAMIKMKDTYDEYDKKYISEFCENNFSEKVIAQRLISLYEEVINNGNAT